MVQSTNFSAAGSSPNGDSLRKFQRQFVHWGVRWLLFFLICTGLGYAAVERYRPRGNSGLSDSALYYQLVAGEEVRGRDMRFRILVPYVARPFYLLSMRFLDQERSVYLALLVANSIFCATTACLLVSVGVRLTANPAVALATACLYLLNFAISNLQLAGLIDAGEACFIMAVTWSLVFDCWWLLPIWGLLGALAKETFVPLAGVFAFMWWFSSQRKKKDRLAKLIWAAAMVIVGIVAVIFARSFVLANIDAGGIAMVSGGIAVDDTLSQRNAGPGYLSRLVNTLANRNFWYVFIWLLPLGMAGLKRLPRAWVIASIVSGLTALTLGLYKNIDGNVARPMFDVMGPMLCLSVALLLTGQSKQTSTSPRSQP